jgi:hypothetical protein
MMSVAGSQTLVRLSVFIRVHLCPLAFCLAALAANAAPPLPDLVNKDFPGLKELGEGRLRFIGIHVYDASVWIPGPAFSAKDPYALELRYAITINGPALTERSIKEMRGQGYKDEAKFAVWRKEMDRVFPDLKPGDRLVGVHVPGKEARFYSQEKFLGTVADPAFAQAFFAIWLDEKTSQPGLRAKLLKLPD